LDCLELWFVFSDIIPAEQSIFSIIVDSNNLVGVLPNELYALDQLERIRFFNNTMISGTIPALYGSLAMLKDLDISKNVIMGTVPSSICSATFLDRINFKMNALSGTIPTCIGTLVSLNTIALDRNMLTGPIPASIGRISSLGTLYTIVMIEHIQFYRRLRFNSSF
jgi:LRR receptor-like serine/threonine-protein kinase FLS2